MLGEAVRPVESAVDLNDAVEAGDGKDGTYSEDRAPRRLPSSSCRLYCQAQSIHL